MRFCESEVEERLPRDGEIGDQQFDPPRERFDPIDHVGAARRKAEQNERVVPPLKRLVDRQNGEVTKGLPLRVFGADENAVGRYAEGAEPSRRLVGAVTRSVEQKRASRGGVTRDPLRKIGQIEKIP